MTRHLQTVQTPNNSPVADADGEFTPNSITQQASARSFRHAIRNRERGTSVTALNSVHNPSHPIISNPPRWQMIEYKHKNCDECHAFIAFKSLSTTDMNDHHEKVVEIALNTICVFHEGSPMVEDVDVSTRSEKGTSRLVVEVTTSPRNECR